MTITHNSENKIFLSYYTNLPTMCDVGYYHIIGFTI